MAKQIYTTLEATKAEAKKLNDARKRDNFEYVASASYDYSGEKPVITGFYVGMCSND